MTDTGNPFTLSFPVPQEHAAYPGHFPGDPLVPGALLLRWMIEQLQQQQLVVQLIKQCKFLNVVRPGDQLQLQVTLQGDAGGGEGGSLTVAIACGDTPIAKAQCLYHRPDLAHE